MQNIVIDNIKFNKILVQTDETAVNISQPVTNIVETIAAGPQGPTGPQGPIGSINTSSFATTGSNIFVGNQTITGSLVISSSADPQFVIGNNLLRVSSSGQLGVSGSIIPNTHNLYSLGTLTERFSYVYAQNSVVGNTGLFNNIQIGNTSFPIAIFNGSGTPIAALYGGSGNLRLQSIDLGTIYASDNGYRLQINSIDPAIGGSSPLSGALYITGSVTQSLVRIDAAGTNGILLISGSGDIGIGTLTPRAKLHISGAVSGAILQPTSSGTPTFTGVDGQFVFGSNGGIYYIYVYMAGAWRSSSLS
jgi:hypothetical protein